MVQIENTSEDSFSYSTVAIRCTGRFSFEGREAEVSCPNISSVACPKIKCFCPNIAYFPPKNGSLKNYEGEGGMHTMARTPMNRIKGGGENNTMIRCKQSSQWETLPNCTICLPLGGSRRNLAKCKTVKLKSNFYRHDRYL